MVNHLDTIYHPGLYLDRDKKAFASIKERLLRGEPASLVCMHGNGIEYPFQNIEKEFSSLTLPYVVKVLNTVSEDELKDFARDLEKDTQPTLCLIHLRIGKDISWFIDFLDNLRIKRGHEFVPFIACYVGDVYTSLHSMVKILTSSMIVLERVTYEDAVNMLAELSERFVFPLTENQNKEIYEWSYGHVALIKSLFLLKKDFPARKFDTQFLLTQPSVLYRLEGIITDLPENLLLCLQGKSDNVLDKIFLEKFGYIVNGKIFNPLLIPLLPHEYASNTILFSKTERAVLEYLEAHPDVLISREEIAKVVWGEEDWEEKYSEWALGQLMYRLRKKMQQRSTTFSIETKKGEGFILLTK